MLTRPDRVGARRRPRAHGRRRRAGISLPHLLAALVVALLAVLGAAPPSVSAHTDFESSSPADGASVDAPVDTVVITFTAAAAEIGDGFVALDANGVERRPVSVAVTEDRIFTLSFDPPLAGGAIGVRWEVAAPDTHPIEGAFSFDVAAPVPAAATTVPPTLPPTPGATTTTPSDGAASVVDGSGTADPDAQAAAAETVVTDPSTGAAQDPTPTTLAAVVAETGDDTSSGAATVALEEFLAVDDSVPGESMSLVGRVITMPAVVVMIGAAAFAATAMRAARRDARRVLMTVRVAGCAVALGGAVEYLGASRLLDRSLAGTWTETVGTAAALRVVGGLAVAVGAFAAFARRRQVPSLSAAVLDDTAVGHHGVDAGSEGSRYRVVATSASLPAAIGMVAVVVSYWFDGHTVSEGVRPLHAIVNSVHLVAAGVWVGGVVVMAGLAWRRRRSGFSAGLGEMIVRFSSIATVALVAVAGAGVAMSVMVLDSFGELTSTEWGQVLLLKTVAVVIAASIGAYNHFVLRPAIERLVDGSGGDDDADTVAERIRSSLGAEAILLVFVAVVTAWLVAAAS